MSTFIATQCCQKLTTKCLNGTLYDKEDKDVLISKLTSRIQKLEQQDKDYDLLNQEFKQLENDVNLLNEAKLRLEYEIKQRDESNNKRISDLKGENENLQNALNDKLCVNKKLFEEKQCLENQLKLKNDEITDLTNKLNNINNRFSSAQNDKGDLENTLRGLNDIKAQQRDKIAELVDDNKKLANLCQEQEHSLYLAGQEKAKLSKKLNDDQANINNLNSKLRIHDSNLNNLQNQLDKSNELNMKLKNDLQNLEDAYRNFSLDNQTMNDELNKQHALKEDEEKNNTQLKLVLGDRKNKLRTLNEDYIYLKNLQDKACEDRNMLQMETGKLEEHIITLTKQNEKLSDEIAKVINEDNQMKDILNRSERMSIMLKSNDSILSQMPQELLNASNCFDNSKCQIPCDENNNRTNLSQERQRSLSPKFTYSRIDKNLGN
jgi:chromosome segregation ATPase